MTFVDEKHTFVDKTKDFHKYITYNKSILLIFALSFRS